MIEYFRSAALVAMLRQGRVFLISMHIKLLGAFSPYSSKRWTLAALMASLALSSCTWAASGVAAKPSVEDYRKIDQMMDGYPVLHDAQGKPVALKKTVEVREIRYTGDEEKTFSFMRDYGYLAYLIESGQTDEAAKLFASQPDRSQWPISLALLEARMLSEKKDYAQIQQRLQAVVAGHQDSVDARLMLADAFQEQDKSKEAVAVLEDARKAFPKNSEVLEQLGKIYAEDMKKATSQDERTKAMDNMENTYGEIVDILPGRSTVPYLYALAYIKQERQKLPEAISYLTRIIQLDPGRTEVRLQLAQFQRALGNKEAALEALKQAFLFDPSQIDIAKALDVAIKDNGKSPIEYYKALANEYPGRDPIQIHYARILLSENKGAEATRILKAALDLHPHNETAWLLLTGVYAQEKKTTESRAAAEKYLEYATDQPAALAKSVRLMLAFGAKDDAAKYLEKLRQLKPDYPELGDVSLQVYLARGENEKALQAIQQAVAAKPEDLSRYPLLVQALSQLNRLNEAIVPLEKARAQSEGEAWKALTAQLVQVEQKTAQYDKAEAVLKDAVAKDPKNVEWQLGLARLYKMRKQPEKAQAMLAEILNSNPDNAPVIHDVGAMKWEMGDQKAGEDLIRQAIKINPNMADYYNTLGYFFSEKNIRLKEALELVQKALQLSPGEGYIMDSLGWIYFQKGEFDKAVKTLEEAAKKEGEDATVQSHLGQAYFKIGRKDDALRMLKSALENSEDSEEGARIREQIQKIEKK